MPLPFPSKMELESWSASSDGLNVCLVCVCVVARFLEGAIQKKNYSTLCRIAICIAILHKEVIFDFENLKTLRSEIQHVINHILKAI